MQIEFIAAPTTVPSVLSPASRKTPSKKSTATAIQGAWNQWLSQSNTFPAPVQIACSKRQMAIALLIDNRNALPLSTAWHLMNTFIKMQGSHLVYQDYLCNPGPASVSQRMKSIGSETVAVAAAIAVAWSQNMRYIGCKNDVNRLYKAKVWDKHWKGSGPDFLCFNTAGEATFIEVKGSVSKPTAPPHPVNQEFVNQKLQSINAKLLLPSSVPARFILSKASRNSAGQISVQWFNDRKLTEHTDAQKHNAPLALAVAVSNFYQLLRALHVHVLFQPGRFVHYFSTATSYESTHNAPASVIIHQGTANTLLKAEQWFHDVRPSAKEPSPAMQELASRIWQELNQQTSPEVQADALLSLSKQFTRTVTPLPLGFVALG